ncbi:hypothetical protein MINTM025_24850 [Mycobacterium intracellulare]|nr:hypothetical protein MINTM025_24850 [Mycobacterium intracellulare]
MSRNALVNLSNVAALSGVAPSTRLTLASPGTFGSARRARTSVRASGGGRGAVTGAATWLDVAGGSDETVDDSLAGCFDEHAARPTTARAMAVLSATDSGRCIQWVGWLNGSGRFGWERCR